MSSRVSIGPTINQQATEARVITLLQSYSVKYARVRIAKHAGIQAPRLDGIPRNTSVGNVNEVHIVNMLGDEQEINAVNALLTELEPLNANIIKYTYIHPLDSKATVAERVGLTNSGYYKRLHKALLQFATLWPLDNLIVYE